jgi:uncharacterized protein with HEPN domain
MLKAAHNAVAFTGDRDATSLASDEMRAAAVIQCFTVIGEAAARLSDDGRALAAGVPWKQIVGMRHNIVHVYWGIDLAELIKTVRSDLPDFIAAIERIIANPNKTERETHGKEES